MSANRRAVENIFKFCSATRWQRLRRLPEQPGSGQGQGGGLVNRFFRWRARCPELLVSGN